MLTSQRKQLILEKLEAEGQVQSTALSLFFSVSEDTIRRDLRELAAEGRLQRVHGGALPASSAIAPFAERQSVKMDAKKRVARRGAQLISPGQVVIIDGGTTTSELITFLPPDLPITVVTHSPGIALGLVGHPSIEVILIGGRLYKHSIVTVGAAAIEGINNIHADLFSWVSRRAILRPGWPPEIMKKRASNVHFPAERRKRWYWPRRKRSTRPRRS